jgi:hypothetical protein
MMDKDEFRKYASYYREGDDALIAIQDNDNGLIIIKNTTDIDDILLEVIDKYVKQQYSNFDGIQHDCIDFYRNKFVNLFDQMEGEL